MGLNAGVGGYARGCGLLSASSFLVLNATELDRQGQLAHWCRRRILFVRSHSAVCTTNSSAAWHEPPCGRADVARSPPLLENSRDFGDGFGGDLRAVAGGDAELALRA